MSENDDIRSAKSAALESNEHLHAIARVRRGRGVAFTTFLRIHACISRHVIAEWHDDAPLLRLNTAFVSRCVEVHNAFYTGDYATAGRSWTAVLTANETTSRDQTLLLARMAYVHILEDLPAALCQVAVSKAAYDEVFGFIVACLDRVSNQTRRAVESPVGVLSRLVNHSFPGRQTRDGSVYLAREIAWQKHLLLKKERGAA